MAIVTTLSLSVGQAPAHAGESASPDGNYVALAKPVRVFAGTIGAGNSTPFTAVGATGVPRVNTTGVLLTISASNSSNHGELGLSSNRSGSNGWNNIVSVLRMQPNETHAFTTTMIMGIDDTLTTNQLTASEQSDYAPIKVVINVAGYFTENAVGGGFVALRGTDVLNTRANNTPIPAGGVSPPMKLTGGAIPNGATAAFLDLIAIAPAAPGGIIAVPTGTGTDAELVHSFWTGGGNVSNLVAVKLNANGEVTFKNTSTQPVHLLARAQGYATSSPRTGSDWRPLPLGRTGAYSVDIPANSTEHLGLMGSYTPWASETPAAGIAVDVQVSRVASGGGFLKIYPSDQAPATASTLNYGGMSQYRARHTGAVVVPGLDGRIAIENPSSQPVHVYVTATGHFEHPTGYAPYVNTDPKVAVAHTPAGPCYAYLGRYSRVTTTCASGYGDHSVVNTAVSGMGTAYSGSVSATARPGAGNRYVISALSAPDGEVYFWDLGHGVPAADTKIIRSFRHMTTTPALANLPAANGAIGAAVGFTTDTENRVWAINFGADAPAQPTWKPLGVPAKRLVGQLTAVTTPNGIRVAGRTADGDVLVGLYDSAAATGLDMVSLGAIDAQGRVALGVERSGAIQVAIAHADNTLWSARLAPTGTVDGWHPVATTTTTESTTTDGTLTTGGATTTVTPTGSPSMTFDPQNERIGIQFRDAGGSWYRTWETTPGSGDFANSTVLGQRPTNGVASDLTTWDYRHLDPLEVRWSVAYLTSAGNVAGDTSTPSSGL